MTTYRSLFSKQLTLGMLKMHHITVMIFFVALYKAMIIALYTAIIIATNININSLAATNVYDYLS